MRTEGQGRDDRGIVLRERHKANSLRGREAGENVKGLRVSLRGLALCPIVTSYEVSGLPNRDFRLDLSFCRSPATIAGAVPGKMTRGARCRRGRSVVMIRLVEIVGRSNRAQAKQHQKQSAPLETVLSHGLVSPAHSSTLQEAKDYGKAL